MAEHIGILTAGGDSPGRFFNTLHLALGGLCRVKKFNPVIGPFQHRQQCPQFRQQSGGANQYIVVEVHHPVAQRAAFARRRVNNNSP